MVNARLAEHRRERRHRVAACVLITAVTAGLAWGGLAGLRVAGRVLFLENPAFVIRRLDLQSDGKLQPSHIREYAGLREGVNLFEVNLHQVRRALESVPVVARAEVRRVLPDTLAVRVTERVALARLGAEEDPLALAVDGEGYVLGPGARSPFLPLLKGVRATGLRPGSVLQGNGVEAALEVLRLCNGTRLGQVIRIASIDVAPSDYLELRLEGGECVRVAKDRIEASLRKAAAVLQTCEAQARRPRWIDATGVNVVAREE